MIPRTLRRRLARLRARGRTEHRPLPGYKEEFPATAEAFCRFLDHAAPDPSPRAGDPVGVLVAPWYGTPLPWFAIALAIGLHRRGRPVVFIWDDTEIRPTRPSAQEQNELIGRVLARVGPALPVVRLSGEPLGPITSDGGVDLTRVALLDEAWHLRGGVPGKRQIRLRPVVERNLAETAARIRALLARRSFHYLVVPNGLCGSTPLFRHFGAEAGVRVSTYDGGQRWFQSSNCGAAAQQSDLGAVFRALWRDDLVGLEPWLAAGRDEFAARLGARDKAQFQMVEAQSSALDFPVDVLIPMNVDFDAASLDRHVHFADTTEWVTETVAFTLARSNASVVVRQHPSERRKLERSRFDLARRLHERFDDEPRIRFVAADEPISSYDLLRASRLVLPFVSTIGIEAAALGKTVLMAGASYYGDLGFVWSAGSREEYFDLLERGLSGELPALDHQAERAWLCYYVSQCCNRVWSEFTPQPDDFRRWIGRAPDEFFDDAGVVDLLTSIDENVPLALVRHRRLAPALLLGTDG